MHHIRLAEDSHEVVLRHGRQRDGPALLAHLLKARLFGDCLARVVLWRLGVLLGSYFAFLVERFRELIYRLEHLPDHQHLVDKDVR